MKYTLWIIQILLALTFAFSGGSKLFMSIAEMQAQMPMPMPGWFLRFLGVCEILGALGMILPGLLRIRPGLTPLAACGFVIIMIGATTLTAVYGQILPALFPLTVGILAAGVAYGRWRLLPLRGR